MRYTYRCNACAASAPERGDHHDARHDRDDHRQRAHHGLRPDDEITETPGLLAAALGELIRPDNRRPRGKARPQKSAGAGLGWDQLRNAPYWQQAVRLLGVGVAVILLLSVLNRLV